MRKMENIDELTNYISGVLKGHYVLTEMEMKELLRKVYYQAFMDALSDNYDNAEEFLITVM